MPVGPARQPQRRLRHADDVRSHRGATAIERGPRGRQLLRLLARPLLHLRRARAGHDRRVAGVHREARPSTGYSPDIEAALEEERLGAKVASGDTTGLRGAVGTPDQIREYLAPLRGGRRRPADLRDAGRQEPPRAHLRGARAVRHRGAAGVQGARRRPAWRPRPSAWQPIIEAAMARKERTAPRPARGLLVPGHAPEDGRRHRATSRPRSGSRSSPSRPPPATRRPSTRSPSSPPDGVHGDLVGSPP